jgi:hypothetical protein
MQALVRRGNGLKIISDSQSSDLYTQISAKWGRKTEPGAIPAERPRLIRQSAEQVYGTQWGILADELGFRRDFMAEILDGFEPIGSSDETRSRVVAIRNPVQPRAGNPTT